MIAQTFTKGLLTLALALGSANSAALPPYDQQETTRYILTSGIAPKPAFQQVDDCTTERARFWPGKDGKLPYQLFRLASSSRCAQSHASFELESLAGSHQHIVLATPEAIERAVLENLDISALGSSWVDRLNSSLHQPWRADHTWAHEDTQARFTVQQPQLHLSGRDEDELGSKVSILHLEGSFALLRADSRALSTIDTVVPPDTRLRRLNFRPSLQEDEIEKPEPHFSKPRYNPLVGTILSSSAFDVERLKKDVRILTGEAKQPHMSWHTRHSATYGATRAAEWIKSELSDYLSGIPGSHCSFFEYDLYFSPNVVCTIPAVPDSTISTKQEGQDDDDQGIVLVSAHYDSRGTFGSTTAPGGDDDGSGTTALLSIARSLGHFGVQFASPIHLVAFSGEEQGLVGSQHYAAHLRSENATIKLALQMDMLAYRVAGEPMQLAFPDKLATVSATKHVQHVAQAYVPELVVGYTPACCSDHQSFWENGFPATWVFERANIIGDPAYHNSGDVSDRPGYDLQQLKAAAQVVVATLLNVAGFYL